MTRPDLRTDIDDYLTLRRRLGFRLEDAESLLGSFAAYAEQVGHRGPVTTELAVAWATATPLAGPGTAARRLAAVRTFTRHLAALDGVTEVPPEGILGRVPRTRPQPHIYSDDEIAELLEGCRQLTPVAGLRPATYVTLFGLLACTGLRLSEVCRLTRGDVDLHAGVLTVTQTKFRKSRLVPIHPTAVAALDAYAALRDDRTHGGPTGRFFRTDRCDHMKPDTVSRTFRRLRDRLGWTSHGRARRPRVHDLRHTFATRRLLAWSVDGVDVETKVLALSTYLGHAKPSDTYWYLTAVPELMAATSRRFEQFATQPEGPR